MATLTGQKVKNSYKDLLQVSNSNSGIDGTLRALIDGESTSSVLQLSSSAVNISSAGALQYAGTAITSTAAELNILDGVTTTASELNVLDGITAGTVSASLGVVVDSNKDIGTFRNITLSGELDAGSLDISGNADIDGTLEADAYTVDGTALNEYIADTVGAMVGSNTETNITVTYEDGDNTLDFVIGTLNQDTTGTAATVTTAAQPNITSLGTLTTLTVDNVIVNGTTIGHTSDTDLITLADGNVTIAGELDLTTLDVSGNADIDGTLETDALTIGGVTSVPFESADHSKLDGIEASATADQSNAEIVAAVEAGSDSNTFTDADHSKLNAIEASADVTDATNVTAAGALMDSEVTNLAFVKSLAKGISDGNVLTANDAVTDNDFLRIDGTEVEGLTVAEVLSALNVESGATADQTDEEIQDIVGAMFTSTNTETGITATYQDATGDIDLVVGTLNQDTTGTASKVTVTDSTANTNFPVVFHDEGTGNVLLDDTGALRYNPSTGELLVPKLTVAGTTTTADTVTMEASNAIVFEGATADSYETTLSIVDPTADHTQYLINQGGYIPVLAASTTTAITSTPAELNVLDGYTGSVTELNYLDTLHATGVTNTEFDYLDGVTSNIQTQLDALPDTAGTNITLSGTTLNVDDAFLINSGNDTTSGTITAGGFTTTGVVSIPDGSNSAPSLTNTGDTNTGIYFPGADEIGFTAGGVATLKFNSDGNLLYTTSMQIQSDAQTGQLALAGGNNSNDGANIALYGPSHASLANIGRFRADTVETFQFGPTGSVFNETSADLDFRVESNGNANMLFVDGGNDRVGIGTASTTDTLQVEGSIGVGVGRDGQLTSVNNGLAMRSLVSDADMFFYVNDGGVDTLALKIDASEVGSVFMPNDNATLGLGAGNDLRLWHDATNSYVYNYAGELRIGNTVDDADTVLFGDDGSGNMTAYLTLDGSATRTNVAKDLRLDDSVNFQLGSGGDCGFSHDGTDTLISNATGHLTIQTSADDKDLIFKCDNGSGGLTNYIQLDGSEVETVFNQKIKIEDSKNLAFGAGRDATIQHDGSNTYFSNGTGNLYISTDTNDGDLVLRCDDGSGGTTAYLTLDGSVGYMTAQKELRFADGVSVQVGNSGDATFFHTSGNTTLQNGTGNFTIQNLTDDGDLIFKSDDGSGGVTAYLTLDGSAALTQFDKHTKHTDSIRADFGNSSDLQIYHDGSNTYMANYAGNLILEQQLADGDIIFNCDDGSGGVANYMIMDGGSEIITVHKIMRFDDSIDLRLGAGSDLRLYHNGTNSYVDNYTGDLYIRNTVDDGDVIFQSDDGSGGNTAYLTLDGSATKTLAHKSIEFQDSIYCAFGNGTDAGIYHDGTNFYYRNWTGAMIFQNEGTDQDYYFKVDDGGGNTITALQIDASHVGNVLLPNDNQGLFLGAGNDLYLKHDGTDSYFQNSTGNLYISNDTDDGDIVLRSDDGSGGVTAYLTLDGSVGYTTAQKHIRFEDQVEVQLGAGGDGKIYSYNDNFYLANETQDKDIYIRVNDGGSHINAIYINADSEGDIYFPNDYQRLIMGAGNDLQFVHDGTNNYMEGYTGDISITNYADDKDIILKSDDGSGGTTAYLTLDGSKGYTTVQKKIAFEDSVELHLGTGNDLKLWHNGTHNYFKMANGNIYFTDDGDNNVFTIYREGGGVQLNEGDLKMPAASKLYLDGGSNTYIYEQSSNDLQFIVDAENHLQIDVSNNITKVNADGQDHDFQISGDNQTELFYVDAGNDRVGIGEDSVDAKLHISNGTGLTNVKMERVGNAAWRFGIAASGVDFVLDDSSDDLSTPEFAFQNDGDFHADGDVIAYSTTTSSDERLKENIKEIPYGLEEVLKMKPVEYDWKEKRGGKHDIGVIAQDIEKLIPEIIKENKDLKTKEDFKSVDYGKMVAVLIKAIQEQQKEIELLKANLDQLKYNRR